MEKKSHDQIPEELKNSKAAQGSEPSWADSYARYYQAQTYTQPEASDPEAEPRKRKGSGAGKAAAIITAVLLTAAVFIVLLAVFGQRLTALFTQGQTDPELAAVSATEATNAPEASEAPQLTADTILEQLQAIAPFCSTQAQIAGSLQHEEGNIPFLSKHSWTMSYQAEAVIGFSTEDIQAEVDTEGTRQIIITLPEAVLQELTVDPDSIAYLDEVEPLFGDSTEHDLTQELEEARADAEQHLNLTELKSQVQQQAEDAVISALSGETDSYRVIIRHQ